MILNFRVFLILLLVLVLNIFGFAQKLEYTLKLTDNKIGLSHAVATIYKNNQKIDISGANSNGEILINLPYNGNYKIVAEEIGHEPLTINVNTTIPKEYLKSTYTYVTSFEMVKKKPGFKPAYKKDAVMKVVYLPNKDNFGTREQFELSYEYVPIPDTPKEKEQTPTKKPEESIPEPKSNLADIKKPNNSQNQPLTDTAKNNVSTPSPTTVFVAKPETGKPEKAKEIADQERRNNDAKVLRGALEREKEKDSDQEMRNFITKSRSRRTFLEEIADSRRETKKFERGYKE